MKNSMGLVRAIVHWHTGAQKVRADGGEFYAQVLGHAAMDVNVGERVGLEPDGHG
jgi:hypothetical protein